MMFSYKDLKSYIPKKDWIKEIVHRVRGGEIWQHSTFMTYYVLLTLFPLLVGIINGIQAFNGNIGGLAWFIHRIAPEPLAQIVVQDMLQVFESSHVGIFLIAAVSTIWTVSWTMAATLMGLNKAYGVKNRENIVILRILAFLQTFVFAGWISLIVFFVQMFGTTSAARWMIFTPLVFLTFCFLYYLVPNVVQTFKNVIPGALFSTSALLIGVIGYRLFLTLLPEDSTFFTLTGSFMVLLAILQKLALAVLAGGTINATIMQMRDGDIRAKNENSKFVRLLDRMGVMKWFKDESIE